MSLADLFITPFIFMIVLVAAVTIAHLVRWISATTAARILIGIPLAFGAAAEALLAFLLIRNDNLGAALFVQIPLVLVLLAFVGTIRPAGGWVLVQAVVCGILLCASVITIFTAGIFIFTLDVLIFFGMMYTAAAAADRDHRNDAYWQYYFSHNA